MTSQIRQAALARDAESGDAALAGRSYDGDDCIIVAACIFFLATIVVPSGCFHLRVFLIALKCEIVNQ